MKTKNVVWILICTILISVIHSISYPVLYNIVGIGNVLYYIVFAFVSAIILILSAFVINKIKKEPKTIEFPLMMTVLSAFVIWFIALYFFESKIPYYEANCCFRQRIPFILYFAVLFSFSFLLFKVFCIYNKKVKIIRGFFALVLSLTQASMLIAPNTINDEGGTLYHIHAYFNPIYNASDLIPFSRIIRSIYGHYSIFYIIPMNILKIFGIPKLFAAMIITVIIGFVSFLLLYIALNKLIDNDVLYVVIILSVSYISFYYYQAGQYYQLLPHRILFPSISLFIISLFVNRSIPKWVIYLFGCLAILWNVETGVVCTGSLLLYSLCYEITEEKNKIYIEILKDAFCILGSFFTAYIFVNVYNFGIGGKFFSVLDFIFPILSKDYRIQVLELKLPNMFCLYFAYFIVFIFSIIVGLYKCLKKDKIMETRLIIFSSSMGILLLTYFMNRASYNNMSISHIPFVVTLACIMQLMLKNKEDYCKLKCKGSLMLISCIFVSFYVLGALSGIPFSVNRRMKTSWDMTNHNTLCELFVEMIPKDTPAAGAGLSDIYSVLGWDPQIYIMDWADWMCSDEIINYALEEINYKNTLLIDKASTVEDYIDFDEWLAVYQIDGKFTYLLRINDRYANKKEALFGFAEYYNFETADFVDLCFLNYFHVFPTVDMEKELMEAIPEDTDWNDIYDLFENGVIGVFTEESDEIMIEF